MNAFPYQDEMLWNVEDEFEYQRKIKDSISK